LPATTPPYHGDTYSPKENPHPPERHLALGLMIQDAEVSPWECIPLLEIYLFYPDLITHSRASSFAVETVESGFL